MGLEKTLKNCPICNQTGTHHERYDAYYCLKCNMWLEPKCGNKHCEFCVLRPKFPQQNHKVENRLRFLDKILGEKKYQKRVTIPEKVTPIKDTTRKL